MSAATPSAPLVHFRCFYSGYYEFRFVQRPTESLIGLLCHVGQTFVDKEDMK
jgi:hypothetical protein